MALITRVLGAAMALQAGRQVGRLAECQLLLPGPAAHLTHHRPGRYGCPDARPGAPPAVLRAGSAQCAQPFLSRRVLSCPRARSSRARPAPPAGHRLRAPGGSRSRRAGHRPDTVRYARQSGRHRRARLVAARSSQDLACCWRATSRAWWKQAAACAASGTACCSSKAPLSRYSSAA